MPTELAHGLQVMQMCQAFTENNCEVELLVPRRVNPIKESPFSYYGVKKIFPLKRLPSYFSKWQKYIFLDTDFDFSYIR